MTGRIQKVSACHGRTCRAVLIGGIVALVAIGGEAQRVAAQVVVSVGVSEIYDDNIYLEDDATRSEFDPEVTPPEVLEALNRKENDNDPNEDLVTNPYIGLSTVLPLSKYYTTTFDGRVGGLIFAHESDENRLTLDGTLKLTASELFIPQPWIVSLRDTIRSGTNDVATAAGTASRQTQTNEVVLDIAHRFRELFPRTDLSTAYTFTRQDFLGSFGGDSEDDELEGLPGVFREDDEGSDFFSNSLGLLFTHRVSNRFDLNYNNRFTVWNFTDVRSADQAALDEDDINRFEWSTTIGPAYSVSERLSINTEVGLSIIELLDDPAPRTVTTINDDGSVTTFTADRDKTSESLIFRAALRYTPSESTLLNTNVEQSRGNDIDGEVVLIRTVAASLSQSFTDRIGGYLAGRYTEFDDGATISSESTNRWEATVALSYVVSEAVTLSLGYNYVNQDSNRSDGGIGLRDSDYESNRVFITLDAGLVVTKS